MKAARIAMLWFAASLLAATGPAHAQDAMQGMDMPSMQHPAKKTAQHHAAKAKPEPKPSVQTSHATHEDHAAMSDMDMPGMAPAPPTQRSGHGTSHGQAPPLPSLPPGPRSADYSDGVGYGPLVHMDMDDNKPLGMLLFDRLEYVDGRDGNGAAFDTQAWWGNDANKLWLKAEGETGAGRLQDVRIEALWDRPLNAFWDTQLGVRHDAGVGPGRSWAAFGVQGLAPYWFEVSATVYVGQSGRTAFRFESEYELLLSQRLILQPRFEASLYGRDDPQRGIGSGLSDAALGLRLRYEFTRQFAPYVGVAFERRFGQTASYARGAGDVAFEPKLVAGLRFWF